MQDDTEADLAHAFFLFYPFCILAGTGRILSFLRNFIACLAERPYFDLVNGKPDVEVPLRFFDYAEKRRLQRSKRYRYRVEQGVCYSQLI